MAGGRPLGSRQSAESIIEKEMLEWAKFTQRLRLSLEKQLTAFTTIIESNTTNMAGQLELMQGLCSMAGTAIKVLDSGMKIQREPAPQVQEDPDAIARELLA